MVERNVTTNAPWMCGGAGGRHQCGRCGEMIKREQPNAKVIALVIGVTIMVLSLVVWLRAIEHRIDALERPAATSTMKGNER